MTDTPDKSIHHRQGLAAGELAAVRELARACEQYDGIDLRIGWRALEDRSADAPHTFLAYRAGALAGPEAEPRGAGADVRVRRDRGGDPRHP